MWISSLVKGQLGRSQLAGACSGGDVTVSDESCTEQYERVMIAHGHECIRGNMK